VLLQFSGKIAVTLALKWSRQQLCL